MIKKKIVSDKSVMFALTEAKSHYVQVAPDSEEYLKIWIKEPTWLEVEKAMNSMMNIDAKSQSFDLDLNAMYRYMIDNFITKTEPSLSTVDLIRLTPFVGNQIKEILPNPFEMMSGDEEKNES
jgi:DNA polymerase elongation subunit (family B)